jgi:magnesium chelatase family protein
VDLFVEMGEGGTDLLAATERPGGGGKAASEADWQRLRESVARARRSLRERPAPPPGLADPRAHLAGLGLGPEGVSYLEAARRRLGLSLRGTLRCARVARTVAALAGCRDVGPAQLAEALGYRREALAGWGSEVGAGGVP